MDNNTFLHLCLNDNGDAAFMFKVLGCISFFAILQNVLAISTVVHSRKLRSRGNMFIFSLILTDMVTAAVISVWGLTVDVELSSKTMFVLNMLSFGWSCAQTSTFVIHMALIALDRYIYIVHPFYYNKPRTIRAFRVMLVFSWFSKLIYSISPFFFFRSEEFRTVCLIRHAHFYYHQGYTSWVLWTIGTVIVFTCYIRISRLALKRSMSQTSRPSIRTENGSYRTHSRATFRKVMRSAKMFCLVLVKYLLFYIPMNVGFTVDNFRPLSDVLYVCLVALFMVHTFSNFYIFLFISTEFRNAAKSLLSDIVHKLTCGSVTFGKKIPNEFMYEL